MTARWTRAPLQVVVPVLVAVLLTGLAARDARGAQAPGFALELLDGKIFRLADLRGSPVVLLFWAPW